MFFALQLTDRVLAPNLTFSERTMVLWRCSKKRKKERVSEREIRGRKLVASVGMRGEEGWDGKATHNLEFTANVLRPIWAKFVSDPALNYKIPTSLCLSPLLLHPTPFLPPLPILFFFFFFFYPSLFRSASCICSTFGCTQRSTLCLFHLLLLSLHHCENGIRVLPWSCENTSIPPRAGCQRAK